MFLLSINIFVNTLIRSIGKWENYREELCMYKQVICSSSRNRRVVKSGMTELL